MACIRCAGRDPGLILPAPRPGSFAAHKHSVSRGALRPLMNSPPFHSGFVCVAGRPNVGKSTLVNRLVGRDISITSPKPQTTRTRILGVLRASGWQAVLVDTPGIHDARDPLNQRLVRYALGALSDADVVLVLVEPLGFRRDGSAGGDPLNTALRDADLQVLEHVRSVKAPVFLVVNKVDGASEAAVLETLKRYGDLARFAEIVPVSALTGRNVPRLASLIGARLPEGPPYFEDSQVTDQPLPQVLGELVRQEVFRRLEEELPYSTAVTVEHMEAKGKLTVVHARILVERDSQKGIVIGKGGRMLKTIGQGARRRMEGVLGTRVYLELTVAVLADWSRNPRHLTALGYPEE
jgi:GTPase